MRRDLLLPTVFVLICVGLSAAQEKPRSGAFLFRIYCAKCHTTADASTAGHEQGVPPGLRHILKGRITEAQLRKNVLNGKNTMPPFRRKISDAELDRLLAYLKTE